MIIITSEQRNPYKGTPPRACVRLRFVSFDGDSEEMELLADTGSPYAVILGQQDMERFKHSDAAVVNSNFGLLLGGWVQVVMPELGLIKQLRGYGSDPVLDSVRKSSTDFRGLAGLPLLRLLQYGGNATEFWVRAAGK